MTTLAAPSLRPMTEDDLDWVVEAEALLHAFPWTRGNFADSLAAGYRCSILQSENRRIAYAVVLHVLDEAHLLNISVVASAQRGGAGSLLLEHLRAQALMQGARHFFLEVRPSNEAAIALYRKSGFTEIGRRKAYYPALEGREDAIVMKLDL
ncbi:ribosomal protein S18-alanine N-acetyltransferase [Parazoarcus communis]|nr:ribosomal protein S18-alanine N-acetyltransferase [Parazoarcus communis]